MKTICFSCGNILEISEDEQLQCDRCGFINIITEDTNVNDTLMNITINMGGGLKQFCYAPFTNENLEHLGDKQREAIEKYLNKERLTKTDYDLLYKLSMDSEWERVNQQKIKYNNQLEIYNFFNSFFKTNWKFKKMKKKIDDLYDRVIEIEVNHKMNEISDALFNDKMNQIKEKYISTISDYSYILLKNDENLKLIENIKFNKDKVFIGEYSISFLSLIPNRNEILGNIKIIEKKLKENLEA